MRSRSKAEVRIFICLGIYAVFINREMKGILSRSFIFVCARVSVCVFEGVTMKSYEIIDRSASNNRSLKAYGKNHLQNNIIIDGHRVQMFN